MTTAPNGGVDNHKLPDVIVQLHPNQINSRLICARAWRSPYDREPAYTHGPNRWRTKIQVAQIISRLCAHIRDEIQMSPTQIQAANMCGGN